MKTLFSMGLFGLYAGIVLAPPDIGDGGSGGPVENESLAEERFGGFFYKHKSIRRFRVGDFEFNNFELRIPDHETNAKFRAILDELPLRETVDIVLVNEEAAAAAESRIVRGAHDAANILTAKDRQLIAGATGAKPVVTPGLGGLLGGANKP